MAIKDTNLTFKAGFLWLFKLNADFCWNLPMILKGFLSFYFCFLDASFLAENEERGFFVLFFLKEEFLAFNFKFFELKVLDLS